MVFNKDFIIIGAVRQEISAAEIPAEKFNRFVPAPGVSAREQIKLKILARAGGPIDFFPVAGSTSWRPQSKKTGVMNSDINQERFALKSKPLKHCLRLRLRTFMG